MTQSSVAILIVTYNSSAHITRCIEAAKVTEAEIVVIDNASHDSTVAIVESLGVRVIANAVNTGFATAVNQGVRATKAPLLLLLNPDAVLETPIQAMVEQCAQRNAGAVGGQLVDAAGSPQKGFNIRTLPTPAALSFENLLINRIFPNNPVNWRYRCLGLNLAQATEVEQPAGALLMFRRDAWTAIHGFDEGFFPIWFEDVDFCKRLRDAGYHIIYRPETIARHTGAHSISELHSRIRTKYWYGSLLRYSIRHFHTPGRVVICLSVMAGALLRPVLGGASNRSPDMLHAYAAVVRLAFRSLWRDKVQFGEITH